MPARSGLESLVGPHLHQDGVIAIAGEHAAALGEQLVRAGGPPLAVEADRYALLTDELNPPAVGRLRDLPEGAADVVVMRRAWGSPGEVFEAISVARKAVRPGGDVICADVAVDRLLHGPSPRYPVRLLYLAAPAAAERLLRSTASPSLLGIAAVRAGLVDVDGVEYDEVRGTYESVEDMWASFRDRGWRGEQWVTSERVAELFEEFAPALTAAVPGDRIIDREPWYAVSGRAG